MPFKSDHKCQYNNDLSSSSLPRLPKGFAAPSPAGQQRQLTSLQFAGSLEVEAPRVHMGLLAMRIRLQTMRKIISPIYPASLALEEVSPSLQCIAEESLGCGTSWLDLFQALLASTCRRGLAGRTHRYGWPGCNRSLVSDPCSCLDNRCSAGKR